jgi:hypothetical protein
MTEQAQVIRDLHTVSQFASKTSFTEPQLRWWIFNAATNGLDKFGAVVRVGGRRVYLDPAAFERWIDSQNQAGAA